MENKTNEPTMPEPVAGIAAQMAGFPAPWCLCGGWAVDSWLERMTREHGDVDISVFAQDQAPLFKHLQGWQLLAHRPDWSPSENEQWWDGRRTLPAGTHIHARGPDYAGPMPVGGLARSEDGFMVEFYIDERAGDDWILSRQPWITFPLEDAIVGSAWGIPVAAREIVLLFKARDLRRRDVLDFQALLPQLGDGQREWLREAISRLGHPWLSDLARKGGA